MSVFPLYDNLSSDLSPDVDDLTNKEKELIIRYIKKNTDTTVFERMYALIRCYQLQQSKDISMIPFDGKVVKNNIQFDLEKMPYPLKHILYKFCILEMKLKK